MKQAVYRTLKAMIWLATLATPLSYANVCTLSTATDKCLSAPHPVAICSALLTQDPLDLSARLALCETYLRDNDPTRAMNTLQQGLDVCGSRKTVCNSLRVALSNVDEKRRAQNRKDPAEAQRNADALRGYCEGPIANQRSIVACQNLLLSYPKDPVLTLALAKKLLKSGQPSSALIYLYKINKNERSTAARDQIKDAGRQRRVVLAECLNDNSLTNCNLALLPGTRDEYQIQRQRGKLLARKKQYQQSLRAYQAASSLRPKDAQTARGVVQLNPRNFKSRNEKLDLFRAQAKAWRILQDADQERAVLNQILALHSTDKTANARLLAMDNPIQEPKMDPVAERSDLPTDHSPTTSPIAAKPAPRTSPIPKEDQIATAIGPTPVVEAVDKPELKPELKPETKPQAPKREPAINALVATGQTY